MLTVKRKQLIEARLARDGQVLAKALSQELGTSEDTIRRDLRELAQEGKLQRVHGGALPASAALGELAARRLVAPDEKVALGRAGAALIQPGQVVILDGGTTTAELARQLPRDLKATVVTHSPGIAMELAEHANIELILLGGRVFRHSMVTVGATTIEAASRIRADLYFMGVTGVHADAGLSTGDYEEACVKRALHGRAAETIVMASSEKLGAASAHVVVGAGEISTLLVTQTCPSAISEAFVERGVAVVVA
ncbi:MAG: DeoR/GlpR family DNA-binding transcription regulator [bacterium]